MHCWTLFHAYTLMHKWTHTTSQLSCFVLPGESQQAPLTLLLIRTHLNKGVCVFGEGLKGRKRFSSHLPNRDEKNVHDKSGTWLVCACVLESGPQRNQSRLPQTSSVSTCASSFLFSLSFFRPTYFSRSSFLSICYIRLLQNPNSIESPTRLMQTRKVINPVLSFLLSAVTIPLLLTFSSSDFPSYP